VRNGKPRIWNNYANIYGSFENRNRSIDEISSFVQERIDAGYKPYFLTFMFNQFNGNRQTILAQMHFQIERFNRQLITRVHRSPNSISATNNLPILIGFADLPKIFRKAKKPLVDVITNDGLHFHAILLMPTKSRIKGSFIDHVKQNQNVYVHDSSLNRIDVLEVDRTLRDLVGYTFDAFENGRISWDDGFMLFPKSQSESDGGSKFNPERLSSDLQEPVKKANRAPRCKQFGEAGKKKSRTKTTKQDVELDSYQAPKRNKMSKAEMRAICDAAYVDWLKTHDMTVKA